MVAQIEFTINAKRDGANSKGERKQGSPAVKSTRPFSKLSKENKTPAHYLTRVVRALLQ
jgi:hypothetical protein